MFQDRGMLPVKQVNLKVTGTNWSTTRAVGKFWKTINGAYVMQISVVGLVTGTPGSVTLSIAGVTFVNGVNQACAVYSSTDARARVNSNSGNLYVSGTSLANIYVSGIVDLESKPDFLEV